MSTMRAIGIGLLVLLTGLTQSLTPAAAQPRADRPMNTAGMAARIKLNAWTVGLAGGLLEGAPIRFATEIARVVDEGDALHVLPVVTRGPAQAGAGNGSPSMRAGITGLRPNVGC